MRKMVSIRRTQDDMLAFQTVARDNATFRYRSKSNTFYLSVNKLYKALATDETVFDKDIYNFAEVLCLKDKDLFKFTFTWLESNGHSMRGEQENVYIKCSDFMKWYVGKEPVFKALSIQLEKPSRVVFTDSGNYQLKEVLKNPVVKKKFRKAITRFLNYPDGRVTEVYNDYSKYSFSWQELHEGRRGINGGLIFHKDYSDPDNFKKGHYSIHT